MRSGDVVECVFEINKEFRDAEEILESGLDQE